MECIFILSQISPFLPPDLSLYRSPASVRFSFSFCLLTDFSLHFLFLFFCQESNSFAIDQSKYFSSPKSCCLLWCDVATFNWNLLISFESSELLPDSVFSSLPLGQYREPIRLHAVLVWMVIIKVNYRKNKP